MTFLFLFENWTFSGDSLTHLRRFQRTMGAKLGAKIMKKRRPNTNASISHCLPSGAFQLLENSLTKLVQNINPHTGISKSTTSMQPSESSKSSKSSKESHKPIHSDTDSSLIIFIIDSTSTLFFVCVCVCVLYSLHL